MSALSLATDFGVRELATSCRTVWPRLSLSLASRFNNILIVVEMILLQVILLIKNLQGFLSFHNLCYREMCSLFNPHMILYVIITKTKYRVYFPAWSLALGNRGRQISDFEACLVCRVSSRMATATLRLSCLTPGKDIYLCISI